MNLNRLRNAHHGFENHLEFQKLWKVVMIRSTLKALKFVKHQIYYNILPTCHKSFIRMKQVWPQPQPTRQSEAKFKIYTPLWTWLWIHLTLFQCFWITVVKVTALKSFLCSKIFFKLTSALLKLLWGYLNKKPPIFLKNSFLHHCISWEQSNDSV